jgi:hypothetical protein
MMADAALVDWKALRGCGGTRWLQNGHFCRSSDEPGGTLMRYQRMQQIAY